MDASSRPDIIENADISEKEKKRLTSSVSQDIPDAFLPEEQGRKMDMERVFKAKLAAPLVKAIIVTVAIFFSLQSALLVIAAGILLLGVSRSLYGRRYAERMYPSFGKKLNPYKYERFQQTVDDLSGRLDIERPRIYPFNMPLPNAAAVHSYADAPVMAVSSTLIEDNRESVVRSIIAHELGHIKHHAGRVHTFRAVLSSGTVAVPVLLVPSITLTTAPLLVGGLFVLNTAASMLSAALRRREERVADKEAIAVTSPVAHADALLNVSPTNPFERDRTSLSARLFGLFRGYPYMANRIEWVLSHADNDDDDRETEDGEPLSALDHRHGGD